MVQNGVEIGSAEAVRYDRLCRPILAGGIVNVDRRWVGGVRIENIDGVCKLGKEFAERIERNSESSYLREVTGRVD